MICLVNNNKEKYCKKKFSQLQMGGGIGKKKKRFNEEKKHKIGGRVISFCL
jgi:hypothetical protein